MDVSGLLQQRTRKFDCSFCMVSYGSGLYKLNKNVQILHEGIRKFQVEKFQVTRYKAVTL